MTSYGCLRRLLPGISRWLRMDEVGSGWVEFRLGSTMVGDHFIKIQPFVVFPPTTHIFCYKIFTIIYIHVSCAFLYFYLFFKCSHDPLGRLLQRRPVFINSMSPSVTARSLRQNSATWQADRLFLRHRLIGERTLSRCGRPAFLSRTSSSIHTK